jgi:hypothetical protein
LRQKLIALGRKRIDTFDFSGEVKRLAELFKTLAGRAKPVRQRSTKRLDEILSTSVYYGRSIARHALNAAVNVPLRVENQFSQKIP